MKYYNFLFVLNISLNLNLLIKKFNKLKSHLRHIKTIRFLVLEVDANYALFVFTLL